jgi:hypothetical protein
MRRLLAPIVVLLLGLIPASASAQDAAAVPKTIPEMWNAWCARCHGPDGSGKVAEPTVTVEPMDFTDCRIATPEPDADWEVAIAHGGPAVGLSSEMPAFGDVLNADQVRGFVTHIRGFCTERGWPIGNMNLPRPIFTEKAFPENEMVFLPVASHVRDAPTAFQFRTIYERRLGRRAQLEVVFPFESVPGQDGRVNGAGDVELGIKVALTPAANRYLLAAGFDVSFSTGAEARSHDGFAPLFEPYVAFATIARDIYVQGQFKLELPTPDSWRERETIYNVYFGRDTSIFPNTWTLGVELNGENRELAVTPQLRKGLTRTGALAAAVGVRLPINDRQEQGIRWVGYLLWEYLDPVLPRR